MNPDISRAAEREPVTPAERLAAQLAELAPERAKLFLLVKKFLLTNGHGKYLKKYPKLQKHINPTKARAERLALRLARKLPDNALPQMPENQNEDASDIAGMVKGKLSDAFGKLVGMFEAHGWPSPLARAMAIYVMIDMGLIPTFGISTAAMGVLSRVLGPLYFRGVRMKSVGPTLAAAMARYL